MISFINDPDELKGRCGLVTGGSHGIGGTIVQRLLSAGARVVAVEQEHDVGHGRRFDSYYFPNFRKLSLPIH